MQEEMSALFKDALTQLSPDEVHTLKQTHRFKEYPMTAVFTREKKGKAEGKSEAALVATLKRRQTTRTTTQVA